MRNEVSREFIELGLFLVLEVVTSNCRSLRRMDEGKLIEVVLLAPLKR